MKKVLFLLVFFALSPVLAKEQIPIMPQDSGVRIDVIEDNTSLIDVENMKKSDKIKEAEKEAAKYQSRKIKLDSREINHQRALDYTTRFTDTMMLPTF